MPKEKDCLICPYSDVALGSDRIICHHPLYPGYGKVVFPNDKCIMDKGLDEDIIKKAFIENHCGVAECTGLSYSTFKRIAEYFYNIGKEDGNRTDI